MGIDIYSAQFLRSEVRRGVRLGRTLTLGHQSLYMDPAQYRSLAASLGIAGRDTEYADDFFRALGAAPVEVMDVSDYEGANILHDLNQPVDSTMVENYDCVFDGGALEHVFNFPIALRNCMELVKVGGHLVTVTPTNGHCGHGFYQFSPELFFNALSAENGFAVERMLFVHRQQWYSVRNPAEISERVELLLREPTLLFISAKRCERKHIFAKWPQQSDYVRTWSAEEGTIEAAAPKHGIKQTLVELFPGGQRLQASWRVYKHRRRCNPANRTWFTPVDLVL